MLPSSSSRRLLPMPGQTLQHQSPAALALLDAVELGDETLDLLLAPEEGLARIKRHCPVGGRWRLAGSKREELCDGLEPFP